MNLKWLFNRGCSCAELRERVSLAERGEALLRDEYCREHAERQAWQRTARIQGLLAERLEGKCERLEREVAMWKNRARHFEQKATEETEYWRKVVAAILREERKAMESEREYFLREKVGGVNRKGAEGDGAISNHERVFTHE